MKGMFLKKFDIYYQKCATVAQRFHCKWSHAYDGNANCKCCANASFVSVVCDRIDEESRKLTTFITPTNSYEWLALPTGAANSPAYFTDACNRMLHYEPEYDDKGNIIYEAPNVVKQKASPLPFVCNYFDDILCTSPLKATYHDTLIYHFSIVEQCIKRMAFHGSKINVPKCDFAKSKILFLGWYVFVCIHKVKFPHPGSRAWFHYWVAKKPGRRHVRNWVAAPHEVKNWI